MELAVFGATGRVGAELVRLALSEGHHVTAVVRDPARLGPAAADLEVVVVAQQQNPEDLLGAVGGRDCVLSAVGPRRRQNSGVTSPLTEAIVSAAGQVGTERLLVISASPVGPPHPDDPLLWRRVGHPFVRTVYARHYADLAIMEAMVGRSPLAWTIVRPPRMVNKPATHRVRTAIGGPVPKGLTIGRADLAETMLGMIADPATFRQVVGVAY